MKEKVINLYKEIGEIPLERLDRFRAEHPGYKDAVLTYAGRLDPLAEGVLLVLAGEENKNREQYLAHQKKYEIEILFGFETDSYDILGVVQNSALLDKNVVERAKDAVQQFVGTFSQPYPPFSSKPVDGKPLFIWTREGKLDEIEVPKKEVEITSITYQSDRVLSSEDLSGAIISRIDLVQGDFRQDEIKAKWGELLGEEDEKYPVLSLTVECSSGTYMRSLAHELGRRVGVPACIYSIKRTAVGTHTSEEALH